MSELTHERLKEILRYDPETGIFTWTIKKSRNVKYGAVAGSLNQNGYRIIGINNFQYRAHRLAWFYITGLWPKNMIDHINRDKIDNRFCNLREATMSQNKMNAGKMSTNKSGYKGVSWSKATNKWQAQICVNGKTTRLGYFKEPVKAYLAYCKAVEKYHGSFASAS